MKDTSPGSLGQMNFKEEKPGWFLISYVRKFENEITPTRYGGKYFVIVKISFTNHEGITKFTMYFKYKSSNIFVVIKNYLTGRTIKMPQTY